MYEQKASRLVGKVEGLRSGANVLVATAGTGGLEQTLTVTARGANDPAIAGPKTKLWVCETAESGLGASQDAQCTVPKKIDWFYRSTANVFKPLTSLAKPYPADLATTTTTDGQTLPFIIRVESGTLNQAI